jgi:hypothetical protein
MAIISSRMKLPSFEKCDSCQAATAETTLYAVNEKMNNVLQRSPV